MKIILAKIENLPEINALLRASKAYWGYDQTFLDNFMLYFSLTEDYLTHSITKTFYVQEELAGFFSFFLENNTLILDHFFIHPHYIAKGYGKKLWQFACETAKELDKKEFFLTSDPFALDFYLKLGCQQIGSHKSDLLPNRYLPYLRYKFS